VSNPVQENTDGNFISNHPTYVMDDLTLANSDAMGDACDPDDDNDGIWDTEEGAGCNGSGALDALKADSDGDRVIDGAECALGSDPANAGSKPAAPAMGTDPDGDGLSTLVETLIGSNPSVRDTDGDGINDGVEFKGYNTNLLVADTDGDGWSDSCEVASLNNDTKVNSGDQGLLSSEIVRNVPQAQKLANMDLNKDGAINSGDQGLMASKVGKCP
jgi:hypothetical protein